MNKESLQPCQRCYQCVLMDIIELEKSSIVNKQTKFFTDFILRVETNAYEAGTSIRGQIINVQRGSGQVKKIPCQCVTSVDCI